MLRLFVLMLLFAAGLPVAPPAQAQSLPGGSWRQSCSNGYIRGDRLYASCQQPGGGNRQTSAALTNCAEFGNRNGALFCERSGNWGGWGGSGGSGGGLPGGSWRQSCRDGYVRNDRLYARCEQPAGGFNSTSAALSNCRSFGNRNGFLFCESSGGGSGGGWSMPGGSWRQSCRDGDMRGYTLYARCQMSNGGYRTTSADTRNCRSFGNRNGTLFCETGTGGGWGGYLPEGSWRSSCRNGRVDGYILRAECRRNSGSYRSTSADTRSCRAFGNRDGYLSCESNGGGGSGNLRGWSGSFLQSCRNIRVSDEGRLRAECRNSSGGYTYSELRRKYCEIRRAGNNNGRLFCEN